MITCYENMCCVCVRCHIIDSALQKCGRTCRGHTGGGLHEISPPSFLLRTCLNLYRKKDLSRPFPSSTVKSNFVLLTNY